jgi:hypothetical protein
MATKKEAAAKKATPNATPKKAAEPAVSQEELLALGEEMNTLLFPGEEVDFSKMSAEEIEAQVKADATNIDPKDQFSDASKATLAAIGIDIEWALPAAAKKDIAAGKKAAAAKKDAPVKSEAAPKKPAAPVVKKDLFEEPGVTTAIMMCIVDKHDVTNDEIAAHVKKVTGKDASPGTLSIQAGDTRKTLAYMKKVGQI